MGIKCYQAVIECDHPKCSETMRVELPVEMDPRDTSAMAVYHKQVLEALDDNGFVSMMDKTLCFKHGKLKLQSVISDLLGDS